MDFIKKNFIVLLAFLLPIGVILATALSIHLSSWFVSTDYNFIYASCGDSYDYHYSDRYNCDDYLKERFFVEDSKLVVFETAVISEILPGGNKEDLRKNYDARIFLHNTEKNESREITLEEAQLLTLNSLLTSPDGITASSYYDNGGDFFPFFGGSSSYGYYLTRGKNKSKLNLINNGRYYYEDNFKFIGWVLSGRN